LVSRPLSVLPADQGPFLATGTPKPLSTGLVTTISFGDVILSRRRKARLSRPVRNLILLLLLECRYDFRRDA
jgi:hypothetical protein